MPDYSFDSIKNLYENTIQKGETFSKEMGEEIQKELEKMYKQKEEWLKNKEENEQKT